MSRDKKIIIKGASIVNKDSVRKADILFSGNKILKVGKALEETCDLTIDASGKHLFPGFIDIHTHLRTPGREDEEDLISGSLSAAKGGFVKIFCMPNTDPALDNEAGIRWITEESRKINLVDIYPVGAITKLREGRELTEFGGLRRAGCLSLSDDGDSVLDTLTMRRALEYAKMFDILIVSHCEDTMLSQRASMRESHISSKYGLSSVPDIAESLMVARDIELAKYLSARIHIAHVSTKKSLDIIRRAKQEGARVTCETCPHYFAFTFEDIAENSFDSNFKVNPPLGDKEDLEAVIGGLKEGLIDCLASDHAPHSKAEKELPFEEAPFGMIGLEFAFSAANTYLVKKEGFDITEITKELSYNPALLYGFSENGRIEEGARADIVIADLNHKWKVCEDDLVSKSSNTPFLGRELEGIITETIRGGNIVYSRSSR